MKLVIIEGPDNTGKNTVIQGLMEHYNFVKVEHCSKPKSIKAEDIQTEQINFFYNLVNNDIKEYMMLGPNNIDMIIHNRSVYGEYVYGCMYRNCSDYYAEELINQCEIRYNKMNKMHDDFEVYLVMLLTNDSNVIVKNEDGKSLSNGKLDKIKEEQNRFERIFNKSILYNKKIVYVDNNGSFRDKADILNEILNFIK